MALTGIHNLQALQLPFHFSMFPGREHCKRHAAIEQYPVKGRQEEYKAMASPYLMKLGNDIFDLALTHDDGCT